MTEPREVGWYRAEVLIQNEAMDYRHKEVSFVTTLWFNPTAPRDTWWIGNPGACVALSRAIPGARVVGFEIGPTRPPVLGEGFEL